MNAKKEKKTGAKIDPAEKLKFVKRQHKILLDKLSGEVTQARFNINYPFGFLIRANAILNKLAEVYSSYEFGTPFAISNTKKEKELSNTNSKD